jgi:hypothetical protein
LSAYQLISLAANQLVVCFPSACQPSHCVCQIISQPVYQLVSLFLISLCLSACQFISLLSRLQLICVYQLIGLSVCQFFVSLSACQLVFISQFISLSVFSLSVVSL